MGFFNFLSGKSIQEHEHKGDMLAESGVWGRAKLEYEAALDKLNSLAERQTDDLARLDEKIRLCREKLARDHLNTGIELIAAHAEDEAREYLYLALELSNDPVLKSEIEGQLDKADRLFTVELETTHSPEPEPETVTVHFEDPDSHEDDNTFGALISALPEEVQQTYTAYGSEFRDGYLALNRGEFEAASAKLERALSQNSPNADYIRLELATAYLNLDRIEEARQMLETFLAAQPRVLPAYQMLCEVLWEQGAYDEVEALLGRLPDDLKASTATHLLLGETYQRSGRYQKAIDLYKKCIKAYGWSTPIAKALAFSLEYAGQSDSALRLYGKIMNLCRGCNRQIDPAVKQRFAELSLEAGDHGSHVLELYLSLAQEDPENAAAYYRKISTIYNAQGHHQEARRFALFAEQLDRHPGGARVG